MAIGVNIVVEEESGVHVVTLEGRLDASTTPVVEKKLANLMDISTKICFDFSKISYLSSAGMRLLLSMTKKMHAKEGKIVFFGMNDDVLEIIKMAGFERILKIVGSKSEAFKSV